MARLTLRVSELIQVFSFELCACKFKADRYSVACIQSHTYESEQFSLNHFIHRPKTFVNVSAQSTECEESVAARFERIENDDVDIKVFVKSEC